MTKIRKIVKKMNKKILRILIEKSEIFLEMSKLKVK